MQDRGSDRARDEPLSLPSSVLSPSLARLSLNQMTTQRWTLREAVDGCARAGLGFLIFRSSQGFQIDAMWVGVFLLAGTGVIAVSILQRVEQHMAPWRQFQLK